MYRHAGNSIYKEYLGYSFSFIAGRRANAPGPSCTHSSSSASKGWPEEEVPEDPSVQMREKEEEKEEAYKADLGSYRQPSESYKQKIGEEEAHLGQEGTYYCARERFYWPALREEVFKLVERCPACSKFASPRKPEREEVEKPPKGPMESVSCDIFHFARKEVLLTVDNFSSFVWLSFWEDTLGCQDCWIFNINFLDIPLTYKPVLFL